MLCQESITKAKEYYNCTLSGVCTDNAKNIEKKRSALQENDPVFTVYGCSAHWLNLLGLDLTSWSVMKHVVEVQNSRVHKTFVTKWFRQAIIPEHFTAYKLHPAYQGVKLSAGQLEIVNDFIVSKSPAFITEEVAFQAKSTQYPAAFFNEAALRMDPVTWWKAAESNGVNSDFADFVIRLLQASASSASAERIFSNFG